MSLLGGIGKMFTNPANLAMLASGPAGWASLAVKTLASSIGQQIIQQLGQQLGLPQSTIDLAQGAFASSMGDQAGAVQNLQEAVEALGAQYNASPVDIGAAQNNINNIINNIVAKLSEGQDAKEAQAGGTSGGWLMALAENLGQKLDSMAGELQTMSEQLSDSKASMTAKFGAKSQEFGMMFNATSTAVKSIGEGMSSMARKQ